jgi:Tfp pilus assembly protein PilV
MILVALVAIGIVIALGAIAARYTLLERDAIDASVRRSQAAWLAEGALERTAARIGLENAYPGETWVIKTAESGLKSDARALITVASVADAPSRRVAVLIEYPYPVSAASQRVGRSLEVRVPDAGRPNQP